MANQKWDFSSYVGVTRNICGGGVNWINDANPAKFQPGATNSASIYVVPTGFDGSKDFIVYGRVKKDPAGDALVFYNMYVLADNANYIGLGVRCQASEVYSIGREARGAVPKDGCNPIADTVTGIAAQANKWVWLKMVYNATTHVTTFFYNLENITDKPWNWTAFGQETLELDEIIELGFYGYSNDDHPDIYADDLEIREEETRINDLELGTAQLKEVYAYTKLGGGGRAELTIVDPGLANKATIKANQGKALVITDSENTKAMFKGEVSAYNILSDNLCSLEIKDGGQKALDNETAHNPILYTGIARHRKTDRLYDKDASFDFNWGNNAYAITMEKADERRIKVHPNAGAFDPSPDDERGDIEYCYFNDEQFESNSIIARDFGNNFFLATTFDFWTPVGALLSPVELLLQFRTISDDAVAGGWDHFASVSIWNYIRTEWEQLKLWDAGDGVVSSDVGDFGLGGSGYYNWTEQYYYTVELNQEKLDHPLIEYMDEVEAENDSGLTHYRMRFKIDGGQRPGGGSTLQIALQYGHLDIKTHSDFDFPIIPKVGMGRLHTDTVAALLVLENTNWGNIQMPAEDGFGADDIFYITKWWPDILADCFAASGVSLNIDINVTDLDVYTTIIDLTISKLFDVLQKISNNFNAFWWYNAIDTIYIKSVDNANSTAETLTNKDIEDFRAGKRKYTEDSEKLRDKLVIEGSGVRAVSGENGIDALSPDYTLTLDTASAIIRDNSIVSMREAERRMAGERVKYEKSIKEIRLPINFNDAPGGQTYTNLNLGETVAYVEPKDVGSKFNFSDAEVDGNDADGELLIIGWVYKWGRSTSFMDLVDLTLQRRYET